jgi:hypothetical protein
LRRGEAIFSAVLNKAKAAVHNFFGCDRGASIPQWQKGRSVRATAPEIKECGGDKMMELGTIVMVDHPKHPFNGCVGKVVGRRGNRTPDDMWILIYFADKMRSYLVPESILSVQTPEPPPSDRPLH